MVFLRAPGRSRTSNLLITSELHYHYATEADYGNLRRDLRSCFIDGGHWCIPIVGGVGVAPTVFLMWGFYRALPSLLGISTQDLAGAQTNRTLFV